MCRRASPTGDVLDLNPAAAACDAACGWGSLVLCEMSAQITSVLVCCTLVVLSGYISMSPDKEAARL